MRIELQPRGSKGRPLPSSRATCPCGVVPMATGTRAHLQGEEDEGSAEATASTSAVVEPLDALAHRSRVKKLSKLALRQARDWRARVAGLANAVLALPHGAPVDDVLEGARAAPHEIALVVHAVGERSWRHALINAMAKSGCSAAGVALDLLAQVRQAGLRPDVITYNTLISACSQSSNLDDAVAVFEEMVASECRPDLWMYNAMLSVHGRCGKVQEAQRLFKELVENR